MKTMKTYYVLWTYIANHSDHPIRVTAESPEAAVYAATGLYSDDFHARAKVYVFEDAPVFTKDATKGTLLASLKVQP